VDAVNFLAERHDLVRTDRRGVAWLEQSPFLTTLDVLRARLATGLKTVYTNPYKGGKNMKLITLRLSVHPTAKMSCSG
jgi:hypothetical protein